MNSVSIDFLWPAAVLLLPLPSLIGRFRQYWSLRRGKSFIAPRLAPFIIRPVSGQGPRLPILLLAWALFVAALMQPRLYGWPDPQSRPPVSYIDIVTVVDISPSMAATDVQPTRLRRAIQTWQRIERRLPASRLALIAYSAEAYPLLPLTTDHRSIRHYIVTLNSQLTRRHGSNLAQALEQARQLLADSPPAGRAILLLSDGEAFARNEVEKTAHQLAKEQIPLLILAAGSPGGAPISDGRGHFLRAEDGSLHISHPDFDWLASIAARSNGAMTVIGRDDDNEIMAIIAERQGRRLPADRDSGLALTPWLLGGSLSLFLLATIRRSHHDSGAQTGNPVTHRR